MIFEISKKHKLTNSSHFANICLLRERFASIEPKNSRFILCYRTPRQVLDMNEKTCTLLIRIYDFIIACLEHGGESNAGSIQKFCLEPFWSCVYSSLLAPTCQGFDVRKEEVQRGLKMTVTR